MATRTVRDCDRCGAADIPEQPFFCMLREGGRMEIDLCKNCRYVMFTYVVKTQLGEKGFHELAGEIKNYRDSTAKHHGATPDDMRP